MLRERGGDGRKRLAGSVTLERRDQDRLLVIVQTTNVMNKNTVAIDVLNNRIAVQICAAVTLLSELVATPLDCDIQQ